MVQVVSDFVADDVTVVTVVAVSFANVIADVVADVVALFVDDSSSAIFGASLLCKQIK